MPPYRNFDFTSVGNGMDANTLIQEPIGIEKGNISHYNREATIERFDILNDTIIVDKDHQEKVKKELEER